MKIIKKPKMPELECPRCGCVFKPKRKNLTSWGGDVPFDGGTVYTFCPGCGRRIEALKDKKESD